MMEEFTFKSVFIPLKRSESMAMRSYYDILRHCKDALQPEEVTILQNLEAAIDESLVQHFSSATTCDD